MYDYSNHFASLALILALSSNASATITSTGDVLPFPYTSGNFHIGHDATGTLNLQNGDTFNTTSYETVVGSETSGRGTLNITGPNALYTTNLMINAYSGNGTINMTNGASLSVATTYYQGASPNSRGILTINGTNSRVTTTRIQNGNSGVGGIIIQNGAKITLQDGLWQGTKTAGHGTIDISGPGSKIITPYLSNGVEGVGLLKIKDAAQLIINGNYFQSSRSAFNFTLSNQYIASTNYWPITGNSNNGVNYAQFDGYFNAFQADGHTLGHNQTYNLVKVKPNGIIGNIFGNRLDGAHVNTFNDIPLYINYFGGDGNDVVLQTMPYIAAGELVNNPYFGGDFAIGDNANASLTMLNNQNTTIDGDTYIGYEESVQGTLNVTASNATFIASALFNGSGHGGNGIINIANDGRIITDEKYWQYSGSKLNITLSADYLSNSNKWAITGNTSDAKSSNDGVIETKLNGTLNTLLANTHNLDLNQTYNIMQIQGKTSVNNIGYFTNQLNDSHIATHNGMNIYIDYFGGDGNDITLYTTSYNATGDAAKFAYRNGNMNIGNQSTGNVTLPDNTVLQIVGDTYIGGSADINGSLFVTGQNAQYNSVNLQNAFEGVGTININNNSQINVENEFHQAVNLGSHATLNITGTGSNLTTYSFISAVYGAATTNIKNGAVLNATYGVWQATKESGKGTINIVGKNSKLITPYLDNGVDGTAQINISEGAEIIIHELFRQNDLSKITLSLSQHYLSGTNNWAITGNNLDGDLSNDGVDYVELLGKLGILLDDSYVIDYNQSYNFIQIANLGESRYGDFAGLAEDALIGTFNGIDIFITYLGGDGNDITLYTQSDYIQGDINGDNRVDELDLDLLMANIGTSSNNGDADHDGDSDLSDLFAIRNHYSPLAAAIPEPTSLALLALSLLILGHRKNN